MELDVSKKNCLADNERYADLINGLLLEGRQLVHYLMPVRSMSYDVAEYDRQARLIRKKVRRMKGVSRAEFLSGFRKSDKLRPCITLILYYGEHWDGAGSLHDLLDFKGISPPLRKYINDYPIHLFEIRKLRNTSIFRTDLKQIFEFIKYSSDKKELRRLVQSDPAYQEMDEDAYDMAVQYAGVTQLIDVKADYEKGGRVNMCRAFDEMLRDERMEGRTEGRAEELKFIVVNMVNKGKTDEEIMELTACSAQLLWEVRTSLKRE